MSGKVLVVEDEDTSRRILAEFLRGRGYSVSEASCVSQAKAELERGADVVLLDWRLPDGDGLSLLEWIKREHPLTQVIMLTAFASVEMAVEAMKLGAYHYLTKPVNVEELAIMVERALSEVNLRREVERLRRLVEFSLPGDVEIVAESPAMREVVALAAKVAPTDATVLITGESGTGKEVVAQLIHRLSSRSDGPFVKINCAAIPEGLLESELFGHEKGAFTGASRSKPGLFEEAHGGTVFLDEIGEMPLPLQAKLLRVLQDRRVRRVGGVKEVEVDVRVVAATNRDLKGMMEEGLFREDLFWRLNVFSIHIPPLRERREDVVRLAEMFLRRFSRKYGKRVRGFTREALEFLLTHPFPGNVRELENMIERATILAHGDVVGKAELLPQGEEGVSFYQRLSTLPLQEAVAALEKRRIEYALRLSGGNRSRAAAMLGISERVLRYKLKKYSLDH